MWLAELRWGFHPHRGKSEQFYAEFMKNFGGSSWNHPSIIYTILTYIHTAGPSGLNLIFFPPHVTQIWFFFTTVNGKRHIKSDLLRFEWLSYVAQNLIIYGNPVWTSQHSWSTFVTIMHRHNNVLDCICWHICLPPMHNNLMNKTADTHISWFHVRCRLLCSFTSINTTLCQRSCTSTAQPGHIKLFTLQSDLGHIFKIMWQLLGINLILKGKKKNQIRASWSAVWT